jgi:two-component system response regulator
MEKTILLVEDNPNDAELTQRALKKGNILYRIDVITDGAQALEYLNSSPSLPTIVLLDLKLPKVDGIEVLRKIRAEERTRRLPVIILTSSREERDLIEGYSNGANSFIRKPIESEKFHEAVRQIGLYWMILNEPVPQ